MNKCLVVFLLLSSAYILPEEIQAESTLIQELNSDVIDAQLLSQDLYLLDQIQCVVCGPSGNSVLADTDQTWKRTLDNKFIPLQKLIQDEIINQQVVSEKMPLDPEAIVKYIDNIKKQLNLNDAQLEQLFSEFGRTMQEGLDMFQRQYLSEFFTYYKFKAQMVACDDEIEKYFDEYPEFIEGFVEMRIARVVYTPENRDFLKKEINQYIQNQDDKPTSIVWGPMIKLTEDDLSADQKFIADMKSGEIRVIEQEGMFELYHVLTNQETMIKPLSERRNDIIDRLNRKKLDGMVEAYNKTVQEFIDVIHF